VYLESLGELLELAVFAAQSIFGVELLSEFLDLDLVGVAV
jgi:hypothetical protein